MPPSNLPYKRLDPVFSSNVTDAVVDPNAASEKTTDPICESQWRSEPIWNREVRVQPALDQIDAYSSLAGEQPPKTGNRDSYRLIDWLTALGLLIASVAIAFALDRPLF